MQCSTGLKIPHSTAAQRSTRTLTHAHTGPGPPQVQEQVARGEAGPCARRPTTIAKILPAYATHHPQAAFRHRRSHAAIGSPSSPKPWKCTCRCPSPAAALTTGAPPPTLVGTCGLPVGACSPPLHHHHHHHCHDGTLAGHLRSPAHGCPAARCQTPGGDATQQHQHERAWADGSWAACVAMYAACRLVAEALSAARCWAGPPPPPPPPQVTP